MNFRRIRENDDARMALLVRSTLQKFALDIPGTAYYDESLDHLSRAYEGDGTGYYVLEDDAGNVIGGIGFAGVSFLPETAELQKLYLGETAQGAGIGYEMVSFIEDRMREAGYRKAYLETHENLQAAIHIYEKSGYREIGRPKEVVHSTMNRFFLKNLEES